MWKPGNEYQKQNERTRHLDFGIIVFPSSVVCEAIKCETLKEWVQNILKFRLESKFSWKTNLLGITAAVGHI